MPKRAKRTVLTSECREFVVRLRDYFERESQNGGPLLPVTQVCRRVSDALGIGINTVTQITKEKYGESSASLDQDTEIEDKKLSTPNKKRRRTKSIVEIDDFQASAIRNHVYGYYSRNEYPTLNKMIISLREAELFQGGKTSLAKILKNIGFRFIKCNKRKNLIERRDIALKRCDYLRKVKDIANWDNVVFLDETWLNANHTVSATWTDDTKHSCSKVPEGKGERLIICHAGTANGFVPDALMAFKSKKTNEYHEEMNYKTFSDWFAKMLNSLEEPHVIIMDNASYHSVQIDKPPTSSNKKGEIIEWLQKKGIDADMTMLKVELLRLVSIHKPREPIYALDQFASTLGHTVVRLPPYHCQYNPIELIWAQVKGYAARHNTTPPFTANKMLNLLREACAHVTSDDWRKVVEKVKNEVTSNWLRDIQFDNLIETQQLIINLNESSSSSSEDEDEEDDLGCVPLE